ncbi:MAG: hypothetical protein HRU13_06335 [Phycisphaerales bacterium]|nr:hypothetical protein [Phycisphaerales bacterium]
MIEGRIERPDDDDWLFVDPCLLTSEFANLIDWFESLPSPGSPQISFMEPLLAFEVKSGDPTWTVRARLRAEAVPESVVPGPDRWDEGIELQLEIDGNNRDRFVSALKDDFEKFPPR